MTRRRHLTNRIATRLRALAGGDAGAGVLLMLAAVLAMVAANSSLNPVYHALFHEALPWTPVPKLENLHLWVNDGLMAVFFFAVGLEIKREVLDGELSSPARRRLPVIAAIAGMAAPALVYLAVVQGDRTLVSGWAIPAATDIAFAVGVLGLLKGRVPSSLRLFLLTVAIVDDIGAVAIIALFYTAGIKLAWLGGAVALLAALVLCNRLGARRGWIFLMLTIGLWVCVLHSGVHATIAGVLAAFTIPLKLDRGGDSLLLRMEHALTPWCAYAILPLFGFANAGVALAGGGVPGLFAPLPLAVAMGLFAGKQAGIFSAVLLSERLGFARRPDGASLAQLWGVALLCGIGFTMSLFIGALAFPQQPLLVDETKLGVLLGSLLSALLGYLVLRLAGGRTQ